MGYFYSHSKCRDTANKMKMASKITSKVVGSSMVRIPWNIVIGIINCTQTARVCLSQGG